MHEYDVTLKLLLKGSAQVAMRELTGLRIDKWLDIELPTLRNPRMDMLGEAIDGTLVHLELQSTNDTGMPLRMAEYSLGVYRMLGRFPRQIVLYVGDTAVRMEPKLAGAGFSFSYEIVDVRDIEADDLLASADVGDNVLAILTRLRDRKSAVHEIVSRMSGLESARREFYFRVLLILAGLRGMEELVEQEARNMPILNDILDHKVIGREFKKGFAQGQEQGLQQGAYTVLLRLIEKRFGPLPDWAQENLSSRSTAELEELGVRVLDAASIDELLK